MVTMLTPVREDGHLIAGRLQPRSIRRAPLHDVRQLLLFLGERTKHGFVLRVVARELEARRTNTVAIDVGANHRADPVAVCPAAMAGVKRKTAEAVEDWSAAMHLDGQGIMRAMADNDVRAGIDRRVADVAHVGQRVLAKAPM